jgi:predicted lysophospholipase L1 biosynthesis ABC-type transport system permease subunit
MANILSWAMIVFSIVCIIMFIVNMLQSYFQKVKRNLGTFKAFGMDSGELIKVYVIILMAIITLAITMSILLVWLIEALLPIMNIMKDDTYNYLSLWSAKTIFSIIIVFVATASTVFIVMNKLLKQTPGDLIYDRN